MQNECTHILFNLNIELTASVILFFRFSTATGRPDQATLMLTGGAQRGLPLEGGCYPKGGSENMARTLISTILQYGGRVLVEARVEEIVVENNTATGVKMFDGTRLNAKTVSP